MRLIKKVGNNKVYYLEATKGNGRYFFTNLVTGSDDPKLETNGFRDMKSLNQALEHYYENEDVACLSTFDEAVQWVLENRDEFKHYRFTLETNMERAIELSDSEEEFEDRKFCGYTAREIGEIIDLADDTGKGIENPSILEAIVAFRNAGRLTPNEIRMEMQVGKDTPVYEAQYGETPNLWHQRRGLDNDQ